MKEFLRNKTSLFLASLIQVSFVGMNVVFISSGYVKLMLINAFLISFTWTFNVKRVVFGKMGDRIAYASGACVGSGIGYYLSKWLITVI